MMATTTGPQTFSLAACNAESLKFLLDEFPRSRGYRWIRGWVVFTSYRAPSILSQLELAGIDVKTS